MIYIDTLQRLHKFSNIKTKDIDSIAKQYLKNEVDVSGLLPHISESGAIFRIYFVVSLKRMVSYDEQISFIEKHFPFLQDWWHVDILPQLLKRAPSFEFVYRKAQEYVRSDLLFVRRWGYVIFLTGFQKDIEKTRDILKLFHDDEAYYVQMAEAWLLADLAIYNPKEIMNFIESKTLSYGIIGKAIQKICDSFRISESIKARAKELRAIYK
jgi:3-methyladenine DNA glycosylase AlkD